MGGKWTYSVNVCVIDRQKHKEREKIAKWGAQPHWHDGECVAD